MKNVYEVIYVKSFLMKIYKSKQHLSAVCFSSSDPLYIAKIDNGFDINMCVHRNIILNYIQQEATFLDLFICYRRCTCFRRFLRPSSEVHNCTYSVRYCQPILLLAATVEKMALSAISSTALHLVGCNLEFGIDNPFYNVKASHPR